MVAAVLLSVIPSVAAVPSAMAISEPLRTTKRSKGWTVILRANRYRSPSLVLKIEERTGAAVFSAPPVAPLPRMISPSTESSRVLRAAPPGAVNCRKSLSPVAPVPMDRANSGRRSLVLRRGHRSLKAGVQATGLGGSRTR